MAGLSLLPAAPHDPLIEPACARGKPTPPGSWAMVSLLPHPDSFHSSGQQGPPLEGGPDQAQASGR
eukprot:1400360-Alexandrium_andersonii.AAC.1